MQSYSKLKDILNITLVILVMYMPTVFANEKMNYNEITEYIKEKTVAEIITVNEYGTNPKFASSVKRELFIKTHFPSDCVMQIVNERYEEVAPPTDVSLETNYGLRERETLTIKLDAVIPSKIYDTKKPANKTVVIFKTRKGAIKGRTDMFFKQPGNTNLYGSTMEYVLSRYEEDKPGELVCAKDTCTKYRNLSGYGITPSETKFTIALRDAIVDVVKKCGGTG